MRIVNLNILRAVCVFVMMLALPVGAVTHYVDPNGSADFTGIQAAINAASNGDEIVVSEGTYYERINPKGKAITIRSTNPLDSNTVLNTVINANGTGNCITCYSGEDANTVIEGFLITGGGEGSAIEGGGMYCNDSSPTVTNCTFSANSGYESGGGMYCNDSSPTVTNCTFSANSAGSDGGGMMCYNFSSPTVTNCTFSANSASFGGGMECNIFSNPELTNCTFSANSAHDGGGIFCGNNSGPTLTNCTFTGNSARDNGGGMWNGESSPTVTKCTFSGNSAGDYGGGMYCGNSDPTLTDSLICGNFLSGTSTPSQIYGSYTDNGGNIINDACPPPVTKIEGDVDGDGDVDWFDFALMAANWLEGK